VRRITLVTVWLALAAVVLAAPLAAKGRFPDRIPLPNGWQPEGIAIGQRGTFYVGSIPTGAIYRGDIKTGAGAPFIPGAPGRAATGLELNHGRLLVAGAGTGKAFVYSVHTRQLLAEHTLATQPTFINDVAVARGGAYFTDSLRPFLYRVSHGSVTPVPLTGDIVYQPGFNANGIDVTPNGKTLVIVQSNTGKVFTVDPRTGRTREIVLNVPVVNGDGILLDGRTLYVVQNQNNKIAVIRLDHRMSSGTVTGFLTDPDFDVPTTIAEFGKRLYAVNARFTTPPTPDTPYWVAKVDKAKGKGRGH
jgi:sugar lactone lactonase YvrE